MFAQELIVDPEPASASLSTLSVRYPLLLSSKAVVQPMMTTSACLVMSGTREGVAR